MRHVILGLKRPCCLLGMPKMRKEQRCSINCVFGTDYKRKKHCSEQKAHMATRKLRTLQSTSIMHDFYTTRKNVNVDSRSVTSNKVILSKMIVVIEKRRIREIHNRSDCSFDTIHRIIHTELTPVCYAT